MAILILALLGSYVVPLGVYFFLKSARKEDKDFQKDCRNLLLNGLLLGFPVFGFSLVCNIIFNLLHLNDNLIVNLLLSNFVLKALSEELMKYLLAKKIIDSMNDDRNDESQNDRILGFFLVASGHDVAHDHSECGMHICKTAYQYLSDIGIKDINEGFHQFKADS